MGCLTRAANGDVTDGDDRCLVGTAFQDTHLEEQVPEAHADAVKPTQRQQLLVNADEVALNPFLIQHPSLILNSSHFTLHSSLHPDVIGHAGLDGTAVFHGLAQFHQRLVEVAEHDLQLT